MVRPNINTLWLFNIAMENSPFIDFIDDFPIKTSIYKGFSTAMLNNQMVYQTYPPYSQSFLPHLIRQRQDALADAFEATQEWAALGIFASYSEGDNTTQQARNQRWPKNKLQNPLP